MDFEKIDPKAVPESVKYFLCHLAENGWDTVEDGFSFMRTEDRPSWVVEYARAVFPEVLWDTGRLTVTGVTAHKFMDLYRRAARGVRPVEEQFNDWFSTWIEREAEARSQLMREPLNKSRREVRQEALSTLQGAVERLSREQGW